MENMRLKNAREAKGMTRAALAAAARTTPWYVTWLERYGHVPRHDLRMRIAAALQVDESEIWPEHEEVSKDADKQR